MAVSEPAEAPDDAPSTVPGRGRDHAVELGNRHRYINRHLSWLDFDTRVLELAEDTSRDLEQQPRRILPGSRRRSDRTASCRGGGAEPRWDDRRGAAFRDPAPRHRPDGAANASIQGHRGTPRRGRAAILELRLARSRRPEPRRCGLRGADLP